MSTLLPIRTPEELAERRDAGPSDEVFAAATAIVREVRERREAALREYAERFGDLGPGGALVIAKEALADAVMATDEADRERLRRVADRIRTFADGQRASLAPYTTSIPGGRAGHQIAPVERAGCYAPGGRYSLPSSVLMTVLTARAAGVRDVWVASPRPTRTTMAAAGIAGARALLCAGGAHAIAALAFGAGPVPPCDVIVGPGNEYVTAAKQIVGRSVGVDAPAGPSELLVVADDTADAAVVAADLLAQAEHDVRAVPLLVSVGPTVATDVQAELSRQLATLPSRDVAAAALKNGGVMVVRTVDEAIAACDLLAPEHLALHVAEAELLLPRFRHYGAAFIGSAAGEVLGDYGAGPNHVLPTGRAARHSGGLSVLTFLRVRTWMTIDDPALGRELYEDAAWLGRIEGLEGHARSAERRLRAYGTPAATTESSSG
jgi:phosphoribosyl-ATP pyrophosphohydrolase/phosphoribosyl-AMP cyclohydrolase/histidinol dehydrogenase